MKSAVAASALFGAALSASVPRQAASQDIDPTVLNFALTLEHLENNLYRNAVAKFSEADFVAAGAPASFYNNLKYIAKDEATHVKQISGALEAVGVTPVKECTYKFPYTDAKSFLGLTTIIEGVGTSAYLGGAPLITSKAYLTVAGSILVSEALHTSLLRSTVGLIPNANPNGTPLDPTSVFSIAAPFFDKCPSDSPPLPFKAYPAASGPSGAVSQGQTVALKTSASLPSPAYLTFVSGLAVTSVQGQASNGQISAAVPSTSSGQTYVLITSASAQNNNITTAGNVIAGPAIIEVTPAPVMSPSGGAPGYAPSPSTGSGSSGNSTAPAPSTGSSAPGAKPSSGGSAPAPSTGSSAPGAKPSSGGSAPAPSTGSGSAPAPSTPSQQVTSGASKMTIGGASLVAMFGAALLL